MDFEIEYRFSLYVVPIMCKLKIESVEIQYLGRFGRVNRNRKLSVDPIWKCSLFSLLPN